MLERSLNGEEVTQTRLRMSTTFTPPKNVGLLSGSTFGQRREDIYRRLQESAEKCCNTYSGRKELATEQDENVAELCEALENAFSYGLQDQQMSMAVTAVNLFQNMHEIVTGGIGVLPNSTHNFTLWDFCELHLTPHERSRYSSLTHIRSKCGRGKAFIRATLNENSLQRYLLTWLHSDIDLRQYYSPWSLLVDTEASEKLVDIVASLKDILFALTVDHPDMNNVTAATAVHAPTKEEPIIYAPTPQPLTTTKRNALVVERPIVTPKPAVDLLHTLMEAQMQSTVGIVDGTVELVAAAVDAIEIGPPDPIEPELEFLKQPLPDFYPENHEVLFVGNGIATTDEDADKSDTSSQYSKSSSANCLAKEEQEEKIREISQRCALLETRVAQLSRENRQLERKLKQYFNDSGIDPSSSMTTNFLITIPQVKLLKSKHGSAYYAYEIHVTMRQHLEHWIVLRRYREFYKLHKSLLRTHPSVAVVEFPPKKHFGNMNPAFVDERRQQLQIYLLNLVETLPQVEVCKSKAELQKIFPFFRER